jgi:hypothetical protein
MEAIGFTMDSGRDVTTEFGVLIGVLNGTPGQQSGSQNGRPGFQIIEPD